MGNVPGGGAPARSERKWLRYDAVLKDLFQRDHPTLLNQLTGGPALNAGCTRVEYRLLDIREFDSAELLRGGPGDLVLALLASGGRERMKQILARVLRLSASRRDRMLAQLMALAGLRRLDKTIKMEITQMGAYIDIRKNVLLKDIWDSGLAEGLARGEARGKTEGKAEGALDVLTGLLEAKFGPLPATVSTRLRKASPEQIIEWSRKTLTADSLQSVLGRK